MVSREKITEWSCILLRCGLGLFFIVVGGMKAFKIDELAADIVRFDVFPPGYEWYFACLGVGLELVIGFCLLFRKLYPAATFAVALLTACFVLIFIQAWIRDLELTCNCLGVAREATSYPFEIGWRLALMIAAWWVWWQERRESSYIFRAGRLDLSEAE